ncbi:hypothetical protein GOB91_29685 [Sinorhizobium meliloti]|nr:hypothetical protein CDO23_05230 [Sinorhizobium meliloti]MDW9412759.1 hypothetical protein [Sinorhizobium meliloti]MDW9445972.1 hypothetical protein [Sinorhizobium meliloti]MDW9458225.1 hypothetical protein [Sinorhizobium meliloti]MDW9470641.1 hypothetical protein [Sinorhizobium meliloti]
MRGEGDSGLPLGLHFIERARLTRPLSPPAGRGLLHVSFNRIRLKDKNMQQIKVLQRPLRVS